MIEDLLILTKTYPGPSTKHREITCVAALNRDGHMRRIFPVPFRLLGGDQQFHKWEWIRADLSRTQKDHRPESHRIDTDSIVRSETVIGTKQAWRERRQWIAPHIVASFSALESRRQTSGETLGFIRPARLLGLDITPVAQPDWTEEDEAKLFQDGLFDSEQVRSRSPLRKLPYSFHYRYECAVDGEVEQHRHMITDWEVGALYWNCLNRYGANWEKPLRQKLEAEFAKNDLLLLMGTVHKFPDQWLIVGLVYPPKQETDKAGQLPLKFGP